MSGRRLRRVYPTTYPNRYPNPGRSPWHAADNSALSAPNRIYGGTPRHAADQPNRTISRGVHLSVVCQEEAPFTDPEKAQAAAAAVRPALVGSASSHIFELCAIWDVPVADERETLPVQSDVPALILAGEYDPLTPPAYGELAAQGLAGATVISMARAGHGVVAPALIGAIPRCPYEVMQAFLHEPTTAPDTSCLARTSPPHWVTSDP